MFEWKACAFVRSILLCGWFKKYCCLCISYFRFAENSEDDKETPLLLDFGPEVELGETVTRQVFIKNHTAIAAPYNIRVEHLPAAKPPTPPSMDDKGKDSKG